MTAVAEELTTQLIPPQEGVRIGPDDPIFLPPFALNESAQVRQTYEPEGIKELARSMVRGDMPAKFEREQLSDGELSAKLLLIHPLSVAKFSSLEIAQKYLDEHADHYGLDIPRAAESLEMAADGCYYMLIAGHRRKRAIRLLQDEFGIPDDHLTIATNIYEDIGFDEALGLQLRENIHEKPPVHEEARSIERYYALVNRREGKKLTIKNLSDRLGMSETKIGDALAFAALPAEVQAFTPNILSYTLVRQLKPLQDLYHRQYRLKSELGQQPPEDIDTFIKENLIRHANQLASARLAGEKKITDKIDGWIKTLRGELTLRTEELFILANDSPTKRRQQSDVRLGMTAVAALELLAKYDRLTPDMQAAISNLAGVSIQQTQPAEQQPEAPSLLSPAR